MAWAKLSRQVIEAPPVRLRPYRPDDAGDLIAGCNDALTRRFVPVLPSPYTAAEAQWWIERGAPGAFTAGGAAYAIADPATDRLIGGVGFSPVAEVNRRASIGCWVAPWARGRGAATAATVALSARAFEHGLRRMDLLAAPENVAGQRVAITAGYRREGVQRSVVLGRAGGWEDRVVWARIAGDPPGPTSRLLPDLPGGPLRGTLSDGVVLLRPLRAKDAPALHVLHQMPDVVAASVPPIAPDIEEIELRCARSGAWWLAGERADLVITDAATGAVTGDIGLYYQGTLAGQAMIGYTLLPAWRGHGYATRAVRLLVRWAMDRAGIGCLIAGTDPGNSGSQRVLERVGFRREGYQRLRNPGRPDPNGSQADYLLYALRPEDLPAQALPAQGLPAQALPAQGLLAASRAVPTPRGWRSDGRDQAARLSNP